MRRTRSFPDPLFDTTLFAHCSRRDRANLARHVERLTVPAGTVIAAEGTRPHAVYIVVDGHVTRMPSSVLPPEDRLANTDTGVSRARETVGAARRSGG